MTEHTEPSPDWATLPPAQWTPHPSPQHPSPQHPSPQPPSPPRRGQTAAIVDVVVTIVGWMGLGLVVAATLFYSVFFGMVTDSCFADSGCNEDLVGTAVATVWGGALAAIVVALAGSIVSLVGRRYCFYWPLIGIAITVAAFAIGLAAIDNVVPNN